MANTSSAKKMIRKIATRTAINKSRKNRMRTFIVNVRNAKTQEEAFIALSQAEPEIQKAATKGAIKRQTASRLVSRLYAFAKSL